MRRTLSTGRRDRSGAEAEARRLAAEAQLGKLEPRKRRSAPTDQTPLIDLAGEWMREVKAMKASTTAQGYEKHLTLICARWNFVTEIDERSISDYVADRCIRVSSVTVNRELVSLSQLLRWCERQGVLEQVPKIRRPRPVSNYSPPDLTRDDVERVLAQLPTAENHPKHYPAREFFSVLWSQGLRASELRTLRWEDIDLAGATLTIRASNDKARKGRTIGLGAAALAALSGLPNRVGLVFGRIDLRASLSRAAARAGVDRIHHHALRHARLSELAGSSPDTAALQFFAGHLHLSTTDKYVRSRTQRTVALVEAADSGYRSRPVARKPAKRKGAKR